MTAASTLPGKEPDMFGFHEFAWWLGIPIMILMLISIIGPHEAAHMAVARRYGVRVKEFGIGLPMPYIGWKTVTRRFCPHFELKPCLTVNARSIAIPWPVMSVACEERRVIGVKALKGPGKQINGTVYRFNPIPLGGYIMPVSDPADPGHINHCTRTQKVAILIAGPAMNFIMAAVIMAGVSFWKEPTLASVLAGLQETMTDALYLVPLTAHTVFNLTREVSGVVGVTVLVTGVSTHAATTGDWVIVLKVLALLNLSVGVFNLLPMPPTDGGQIAMALDAGEKWIDRLLARCRITVAWTGPQVEHALLNMGALTMFLILIITLSNDILTLCGL